MSDTCLKHHCLRRRLKRWHRHKAMTKQQPRSPGRAIWPEIEACWFLLGEFSIRLGKKLSVIISRWKWWNLFLFNSIQYSLFWVSLGKCTILAPWLPCRMAPKSHAQQLLMQAGGAKQKHLHPGVTKNQWKDQITGIQGIDIYIDCFRRTISSMDMVACPSKIKNYDPRKLAEPPFFLGGGGSLSRSHRCLRKYPCFSSQELEKYSLVPTNKTHQDTDI